ncbi:MAG: hypothetical protein IPJ84_02730 [Bdellovibrionales bacterium]|nr:hypothetical protein [Bdellovibrionales bacterium]
MSRFTAVVIAGYSIDMNILTGFVVLVLSVSAQAAFAAPVVTDADLAELLTPLKTVGDLKTEVLKSTRGPFAEFFETQLKGHEKQKIEIRRLQGDEFVLRIDNRMVTIEFHGAGRAMLINKQPVEINWGGRPEEEFKKIQDALPKQASYAPGFVPIAMRLMAGDDAFGVAYIVVFGAAAAGVSTLGTNYYRCAAIEESAKKCERFGAMSEEDKESANERQFASETAKKYSAVLVSKHLFCSKERPLKECLKRRGFDVDLIQSGRGSEEQMRGSSGQKLSQ